MVYAKDFSDSDQNDNDLKQINVKIVEKQTAKERFNNMRDIQQAITREHPSLTMGYF